MTAPPDDAARIIAALQRENARLRAEQERRALDPDEVRRALLIRACWRLYPGMRRTTAAKALAADWAAFAAAPASLAHDEDAILIFRELQRAGVRPLAWRQIADIIDPELHTAKNCKFIAPRA